MAAKPSAPAAIPFDFSPDFAPFRPVLSPEQLRFCSEALGAFKVKSLETIDSEFRTLQDHRPRASE